MNPNTNPNTDDPNTDPNPKPSTKPYPNPNLPYVLFNGNSVATYGAIQVLRNADGGGGGGVQFSGKSVTKM